MNQPLTGSPQKPGREPAPSKNAGEKGSQADIALMDAVIVVGLAWALVVFFAVTLRRYNV